MVKVVFMFNKNEWYRQGERIIWTINVKGTRNEKNPTKTWLGIVFVDGIEV